MINKKIAVYFYIFIMIFLLLVSTTNILFDEDEQKVYNISIIMNDKYNSKFDKFDVGVEDGVFDLSVDINYVYLEESNSKEQIDALNREVQRNIDGIVILPVDDYELSQYIMDNNIEIPIVSVGEDIGVGYIGTDYFNMGVDLARSIEDSPNKVYAYADLNDNGTLNKSKSDIYNGMESILGSRIELATNNKKEDVMVALDKENMDYIISEYVTNDIDIDLYGVGYENDYLYYLNNKQIKALAWYDEYLEGYLSINELVNGIEDNKNYTQLVPNYLAEEGEVYDYEKKLFPID